MSPGGHHEGGGHNSDHGHHPTSGFFHIIHFLLRYLISQEQHTESQDTSYFRLFVGLQLAAAGGIVLVLLTAALCKAIRRYPTWYSYCTSWVIFAFSYSLLVLKPEADSNSDFSLCLTQASFIYASRVLTSWTTLSLVSELWLRNVRRRSDDASSRSGVIALIALPYFLAFIVLLQSFVVASDPRSRHNDVYRKQYSYCSNTAGRPTPAEVSSLLVFLATFGTVVVQIDVFRRSACAWLFAWKSEMPVPLACWLLIRPALFTLYAIVTYLIGMFDGMDSTPDTFLALMPMIALLLFGTHLDILHAWMFWRRRKSEEEPNENPVEKMPATEMTEVIVIDAASSRIVTYP